MRIGFDVDGVLADFANAYQRLIIEVSGKNLFHPTDGDRPPCWDWPEFRGYDKATMKEVWGRIKASERWNLDLDELEGCRTLRMCILDMMRWHDIYFVTNRPSKDAKWQTEQWLMLHLGIERPTVLISEDKGPIAKALKLDVYIDDKFENIVDTLKSSQHTRAYLLDKTYNQNEQTVVSAMFDGCVYARSIVRVPTVGKMLDAELVNL